MSEFKKISVDDIQDNPFTLIGKEWMLITAGSPSDFNTMTASWGGVGVLWKKNVCFLFVRKSRYTYDYMENSDNITLSFFPEEYKKVLSYCDTHSGRDVDKCKETGLTPIETDGGVSFDEARLVLSCRKLYSQDIDLEKAIDKEILGNYADGDIHRVYYCEITEAYTK